MLKLLSILLASLLSFNFKQGIKWFRKGLNASEKSGKNRLEFAASLKSAESHQSHPGKILKLCDENMDLNIALLLNKQRTKIPFGGWANSCVAVMLLASVVSMTSREFSSSDCYSWYSLLTVATTCVVQKLSAENNLYNLLGNVQIVFFRLLPSRMISRLWGKMCAVHVKPHFRPYVYKLYIKMYKVNIEEAMVTDLKRYESLGHFFRRKLNPGFRPISGRAQVVSPVDGTIVFSGLLFDGAVQSVKGIDYSINKFLGPLLSSDRTHVPSETRLQDYMHRLMSSPGRNHLYSWVIYLAPGDYHRFHSPAGWAMEHRRHFAGDLLSVNPVLLSWIPDLFVLNERVVMSGCWKHGYFSMTAVGALNVGSIVLYKDKNMTTNRSDSIKNTIHDRYFPDRGVRFEKGDEVGEFRLGSTVVIICEVPKSASDFEKSGRKIKYGETLALF